MFASYETFDLEQVGFDLGVDRTGKPKITVRGKMAMVTAPAVTMWPRCTGDGNYGTMWGPDDPTKAKFTLDLTDEPISGRENAEFAAFAKVIDAIDDALLAFVADNQQKILNRQGFPVTSVKMLQVRGVKPKSDKTGTLTGHWFSLSTPKFKWGVERSISICDHEGKVIPDGTVRPGDLVAATISVNQVYTGVGGDKFGIQWNFHDVQVIRQSAFEQKTEVAAFQGAVSPLARPYVVYE
jgi:hypothetical protein